MLKIDNYEFEEPEFKCELLKVVDGVIIGYYIELGFIKPTKWGVTTGEVYSTNLNYNLIPVKKKWYELEANVGQVVAFFDVEGGSVQFGKFHKYISEWSSPFVKISGECFKFARPLRGDEIAIQGDV